VLVQNGAGSTVGQAVIQIAAAKGVKTVNLVRHGGEWAKVVAHLQGLGATTVVAEEQAGKHEFRKTLADVGAGTIGLNSTGGAAAGLVARALAPGATLVTYGSSSGRPVSAPLDLFTHKDLSLRGFNLEASLGKLDKAERDAFARDAVAAVANGSIKLLVAREPFRDFNVALGRTLSPHQRKVVLVF
jgi:mitochondrial enoyl-[acyl-carrier protein] reductase / trans-2-enoyl-CoA reductase